MITARHEYMDRPSLASDLVEFDRSQTKQSDLKDCDINAIMKRYERTGLLPDLIAKNGTYGDFSDAPTLQEAFAITRHAEEQWANIDATVRNRFDNDPVKFAAFATDPNNVDEMEKMGLLKPEVVASRQAQRKADAEKDAADRAARKAAEKAALVAEIKAELAG